MEKKCFNSDWKIISNFGNSLVESMINREAIERKITLPYDAMIYEEVDPNTKNGGQTGYYPGKTYTYLKRFVVPQNYKEKKISLEFEGVMGSSRVYLNGEYLTAQSFGYTNFYVDLNDALLFGAENLLEVKVTNEMECNSRWYSGTGIYRDVNLYIGEEIYIPENGILIKTSEIDLNLAVVEVDIHLNNRLNHRKKVFVMSRILNVAGEVLAHRKSPVTLNGNQGDSIQQRMEILNPELWNVETPNLYKLEVVVLTEEGKVYENIEEKFGIRSLRLDPVNGLRINGKTVKLRGTCIHHDHGIIGTSAFEKAEERKIRKLKEAGFNCIRMSHHPAGKKLLEVCDRLGMLVIDELFDMWTQAKNTNDFSNDFYDNWETIAENMVLKDFNHPSVIIYSMGNEIQEAGTPYGAQINRSIHRKLKSLDPARYTTNGVNGVIAAGEQFEKIVFDAMEKLNISLPSTESVKDSEHSSSAASQGSNQLNAMMQVMMGPLADTIATSPYLTEILEEFMEGMDIAGYNYLTGRHVQEHELYPHRLVLGTETFPADIPRLWEIVSENNHVLGDMTWTGYDYLGEAGVGIFHYDGGINFEPRYPERVAYIGDIDLIGNRRPMSYYREIVYGIRKIPYIAVERLNRYGAYVERTPWMWKDTIASWDWPDRVGQKAVVHVLSDAPEVELLINGISQGIKQAGKHNAFMATFEVCYQQGMIEAIAIRDGQHSERFILKSATEVRMLDLEVESPEIKADSKDLAYVMISLKDENGVECLNGEEVIYLTVTGPGELIGFGSANPICERSYSDMECPLYDGKALAVIRSTQETGTVHLKVSADGFTDKEVKIHIREWER